MGQQVAPLHERYINDDDDNKIGTVGHLRELNVYVKR